MDRVPRNMQYLPFWSLWRAVEEMWSTCLVHFLAREGGRTWVDVGGRGRLVGNVITRDQAARYRHCQDAVTGTLTN